jgi:AcrR family transcriptional regulator
MSPSRTASLSPADPEGANRRSDRARVAIITAAWELFGEVGLRDLTIEAIAKRAGVGKTTIYRWWSSKSAVVLEALREHFDAGIGFADTGSAAEDLRRQLRALIRLLRSPVGDAFLMLVAEGRHDPELARAMTGEYFVHRWAAARAVIERGVQRGELRPETNPDTVIDLLYGAIYYRFTVRHERPGPSYADNLVNQVLAGVAAGPR